MYIDVCSYMSIAITKFVMASFPGMHSKLHACEYEMTNYDAAQSHLCDKRGLPAYALDAYSSVVGVDATKHVQLPISSEPTGLVVLQWFNHVVLTIAQLELICRPGSAGIPFYRLLRRS